MVTPDDDFVNAWDWAVSLFSDLPDGSVVIKSGHGSEVFLWQILGVGGSDEAVSVGWVAYNQSFNVSVSVVVKSLSLRDEDLGVFLEEVTSFHAFGSWLSTNQEGSLDILETDLEVVGTDDFSQKREGAITQLHGDTRKSLLGLGDIDEVEDDGLVLAEHITVGNSEQQ